MLLAAAWLTGNTLQVNLHSCEQFVLQCMLPHALRHFFPAGMVDMANEVFATLQPHLQHSSDTGQQVLLGGHSLGGALAVLVASLAKLQLAFRPQQLSCTSFGSPPVLRHAEGKGEADILQVRSALLLLHAAIDLLG